MTNSDESAHRRQRLRASLLVGTLCVVLVLSGCNSNLSRQHAADDTPVGDVPALEEPSLEDFADFAPSTEPVPQTEPDPEIWSRLRQGFRFREISHPSVAKEIRLLQRSPNAFRALMARSEPYLYHILNEMAAAGLPGELVLLPAIESGYQAHAHSPEGAAGLWQFMPATGRMMGLEQDWWFDTRRTVRASTSAAIDYLGQLNRRFSGDWLLTLAAYNAGAGKVERAIRKADRQGRPSDFWSLDLPGETERYVPRLLALASVVADPEAYGLDLPEILDQPYFAPVLTEGQIDLTVAAQLAGVPVEDLLVLNAGCRRWSTRPDGPHEILLPRDNVDRFAEALVSLPADKRLRWQHHRIQPGDSLNRIARRYGVSVEAIRKSNRLQDSRIRAGDDLVIPLSDSVTIADTLTNRTARQRLHYRVRRGDSLYTIARRYQVSIADLRRWNQVGRYIRPGERLTLFVDPDA